MKHLIDALERQNPGYRVREIVLVTSGNAPASIDDQLDRRLAHAVETSREIPADSPIFQPADRRPRE